MAAAEVDFSYLTAQAGVPEPDLNTALTAPTAELVRSVLETVVTKLRDLEQEKFQVDIELEGAIRSSESRCEQFKETADKALKEVEELRQKLQSEGEARLIIATMFLRGPRLPNVHQYRNCPPVTRERTPDPQVLRHSIAFRNRDASGAHCLLGNV